MAGLHELYGVASAQELLGRIRAPRERRPRRIRVDREAIRQQLEKEGVPRWDVEHPEKQPGVNTKGMAVAGNLDPNDRSRQEENVEGEVVVTPVRILIEEKTDSDGLDGYARSISSLAGGEDEVVETPLASPQPQVTSTPKGYILPVPPRRRVCVSPNKTHKEGAESLFQEGLMVQNLHESSFPTSDQSVSGPITTVQILTEESEVLKGAKLPSKKTVVKRKKQQDEQHGNEDVDNMETEHSSDQEVSEEIEHSRDSDQEVWLVDAGESSRPASGITDLDIAMTVVKRVCQNYGCRSKSRCEQNAIRLFYHHMKTTCAKTIKDLHQFQKLQQALKKLRSDRKKQMEQLLSLERRKAKINGQVIEGWKKLTELKDKKKSAEGCLKFLKKLELLRN